MPTVLNAQARRDTTLPELVPREVEIVGEAEIGFPSLERQPLTGFNPPPRIFQIPRGRIPYTRPYKQPTADIPGTSLIKPATPPTAISVGQNPNGGELIVGVGSYLSREIHGIAAFDLSRDVRVSLDLLHDGYDSFKPFSDSARSEVEAPFTNFDGTAGLEYSLGASTLGIDASGFAQKYNLYGLTPETAGVARPERDGQGFGVAGSYSGGATTAFPFLIEAEFGSDRFKTSPGETDAETGIETKETFLDASADGVFEISEHKARLDGAIGRRSIERDGDSPFRDETGVTIDTGMRTSVTGYHAGGDLIFELGMTSTLRLGVQLQGYSTSDGHLPDTVESSKFYVAPRVEYRNTLTRGLEFYAMNAPLARQTSQRDIFEVNPFGVDGPLILPELSAINLEGGLILYAGPLRLSGGGGYAVFENYLFFDPDSNGLPGFSGRLFTARYGDVDTYFFGGDVALAFPGTFSIAVTGDWRSATLDPDEEVPYFPTFEGGVRATYTFADDRAILQADGKYVGSRKIDRAGSEELSAYLDLSALASYYVTPQIGIYARAKSMTGERFERWAGYPASDWIVMGGIRLRWKNSE